MRETISQHFESLRARSRHFWQGNAYYDNDFRPALNISALLELIDEATSQDAPNPSTLSGKGKRRAASPPTLPSSKRIKTTAGNIQSPPEKPEWIRMLYPSVTGISRSDVFRKSGDAIPVFHHIFELQYTTAVSSRSVKGHFADGDFRDTDRWTFEENRLVQTLKTLSDSLSEPKTVDLCKVSFAEYKDRLVARAPSSTDLMARQMWLLLVPRLLDDDFEMGDNDYSSNSVRDLMKACQTLQSSGRALLDGHLKLVLLPATAFNRTQTELPFRLQIEVDVSLIIPTIYEPPPRTNEIEDAQRSLLHFLYPSDNPLPSSFEGENNISYFYSILRPAPALQVQMADQVMQPNKLLPTLLPFQRRSVAWMLEREGMTITPQGEIIAKAAMTEFSFWDRIQEGNQTWYLHRLSGALSPEPPEETPALGGILAEEPGLGKTLETIALILLNPAPADRNPTVTRWDSKANLEVKAIKTTLIVTPPALAQQWGDEFAAHAPSLKVLVYEGWSKERSRTSRVTSKPKKVLRKKKKGKARRMMAFDDSDSSEDETKNEQMEGHSQAVLDWCNYVNTFDVVITTYSVLRTDFNVARAVPVRPRREDVFYSNVEAPRSPLVQCEWNRVVMDEVQMVGGKTEDMVSLIPRLSSFAVSGTPARTQVSDLMHVLRFLRADNIVGSSRLWARLLKPGFAAEFAAFFQHIAIRTMKSSVKDELTIPQQTRYLVSIDMGRVERDVYDRNLDTALLELGLDARGVASTSGWQVDAGLLRNTIRRLRGICTHPQVGQLVKPGDKLYKPGALKTMAEVLEMMRDQNWRNTMDDRKTKIQSLIRTAQLQHHDDEDRNRYQHTLETLLVAEKETKQLIEDVEAAIGEHNTKGEVLKREAIALREGSDEAARVEPDSGKGKQRQRSLTPSVGEDSDDGDLPRTPAGEEHGVKRRALRHRLRECRLTLHRVKFLQGDAYHMLGESHSASEDTAYTAAEDLRRDILKGPEDDAVQAMAQLTKDATSKGLNRRALIIPSPYLDQGARDIFNPAAQTEEANDIIEDVLNEQSHLLWEWRTQMNTLLTKKLSPGDQADGQEYQRTLDDQGEAETYLQAYTALLADRRESLVNERTLLAAHDAREKRLRHTKAAMKAAAAAEDALEIPDDIELQPEHEVLHKELSQKRKDLLKRLHGRAVKSILVDLTDVASRIQRDSDPEKILVKEAVSELRRLIIEQGLLHDKLDADLALIRKAFNQRILYFRQLQEISDSVADVILETTLAEGIQKCKEEQAALSEKVNASRARQRYLDHIAKSKGEAVRTQTGDEDEETCILCREDFKRGFLTACAHVFCEECMKSWLLKKEGKTCPVCRVPINIDNLQRFSMDHSEALPAKPINGEPAPKSRRQIAYNMIDPKLFQEIQTIESFGDFGNKIQALIRHLLYLQMNDPGAKSIVFSAWADSLHIMERALIDNGIRCLRIDQNKKGESAAKKFQTDSSILVLLLHGERENAGLNITCASRVFLLESVVHHGFEIQAIARIDRMGQKRPTEVYCYYAEDTVERNILDLAARKGLSLYTKENSAGTLNVSSFAGDADRKQVDSPAKKVQKGDFIFKIDDMLAVLFPHMYEDVEYLLPPEDTAMEDVFPAVTPDPSRTRPISQLFNAVAGPSRLQ